jgi:LuxR family maltose regulon positive regulatory protein
MFRHSVGNRQQIITICWNTPHDPSRDRLRDPPLPLARLRGRGALLEIRADDLRFTPRETKDLLKQLHNLELNQPELDVLHARTEGWAVGLKMAAISMGRQKNIRQFLQEFSGSQRFIMDYLLEEVINRQSPEVQEFLLQTSVLDRLCAPLCNTVTRRNNSREMLNSGK